MAITAHWIETEVRRTSQGPRYNITLQSALVGFHRVPGRHTGDHLAAVFLNIIDRLHITKVRSFNSLSLSLYQIY